MKTATDRTAPKTKLPTKHPTNPQTKHPTVLLTAQDLTAQDLTAISSSTGTEE